MAQSEKNKQGGFVQKAKTFLTKGQWRVDLKKEPKAKAMLIGTTRVATLAVKEFFSDQCTLWASSLTYVTTLSIVPFLAVAFTVTKSFKIYGKLHDEIIHQVQATMPDFVPLVEQVLEFTENVNVNTLGLMGTLFTIVTVILMLGNIEKAFNQIWIVKKERSFFRKITDYLTMTILLPILLIIAFTLAGAPKIRIVAEYLQKFPFLNIFMVVFEYILPILLIWLAILALYKLMPNAKVKWKSIALASFLVAIVWIVTFSIYVGLQIGYEKNQKIYATDQQQGSFTVKTLDYKKKNPKNRRIVLNKKYKVTKEVPVPGSMFQTRKESVTETKAITFTGLSDALCERIERASLKPGENVAIETKVIKTPQGKRTRLISISREEFSLGKAFAQIPVLLLLLYISWALVLGGAEIAFAHQNISSYQKEAGGVKYSYSEKELITLLLLQCIGKRFSLEYDKAPYTAQELADKLNIPFSIVIDVLEVLESSKMVLSKEEEEETQYALARPPAKIAITEVLEALKNFNSGNLMFVENENVKRFRSLLDTCDKDKRKAVEKMNLKDVVEKD